MQQLFKNSNCLQQKPKFTFYCFCSIFYLTWHYLHGYRLKVHCLVYSLTKAECGWRTWPGSTVSKLRSLCSIQTPQRSWSSCQTQYLKTGRKKDSTPWQTHRSMLEPKWIHNVKKSFLAITLFTFSIVPLSFSASLSSLFHLLSLSIIHLSLYNSSHFLHNTSHSVYNTSHSLSL